MINRPEAISEERDPRDVWFTWSDNRKGQCISERTEWPNLRGFHVQCAQKEKASTGRHGKVTLACTGSRSHTQAYSETCSFDVQNLNAVDFCWL